MPLPWPRGGTRSRSCRWTSDEVRARLHATVKPLAFRAGRGGRRLLLRPRAGGSFVPAPAGAGRHTGRRAAGRDRGWGGDAGAAYALAVAAAGAAGDAREPARLPGGR